MNKITMKQKINDSELWYKKHFGVVNYNQKIFDLKAKIKAIGNDYLIIGMKLQIENIESNIPYFERRIENGLISLSVMYLLSE